MIIQIFGKQNCAKCVAIKNKVNHFAIKWNSDIKVIFQDMETVDGTAEGAYYDILTIPTIVITQNDAAVKRWVNEIPLSKDLKKYLEVKNEIHTNSSLV